MLVVSELGEACEAYRKGKYADLEAFEKAKLDAAHYRPSEATGEDAGPFLIYVKDSFEDEIADSIIRLLDLSGFMGIDIDKHIELKMKYNAGRPYKHGKLC